LIVLDASALIAHFETADAHHDRAVALLDEFASRGFGASSITLAEVLVDPARAKTLSTAEGLLHSLAVREIPLGSDCAIRLAMLRAETGCKLPDCCVLLAAQDISAEAIFTFDERLAKGAAHAGIEPLPTP
jgi:predicted nucleic acid-binding protein